MPIVYHGPLQKSKEEMIPMEAVQTQPGSGRVAIFARNIRTAFAAARAGNEVAAARRIPVLRTEYWSWTAEACLDFTRPTREAVREVFRTFDEDVQHSMTFAPQRGEWVQRAKLWKEALRPVLPPEQYHEAMAKILAWCVGCVRRGL